MLQNAYLDAKIGVDTQENGPSKVWCPKYGFGGWCRYLRKSLSVNECVVRSLSHSNALDAIYTIRSMWQLSTSNAVALLQSAHYNQRGPLEYPFFRPFLRLVLSCINADFCVQGRIFQHFSSSTFFPLHHSRFL